MLPLMGLYFDIYTQKKSGSVDWNVQREKFFDLLMQHKDKVFPTHYMHSTCASDGRTTVPLERRELFGNVIERMEEHINSNLEHALTRAPSVTKFTR